MQPAGLDWMQRMVADHQLLWQFVTGSMHTVLRQTLPCARLAYMPVCSAMALPSGTLPIIPFVSGLQVR